MADIKHFVIIKAPAKSVYEAVTIQKGIAGWWATETVAKPEVGFVNEIKFDTRYHNKMKVTKLIPNKLVEWECLAGDPEWVGTHVRFELTDKGDKTELLFTQADWAAQSLFYANCSYHWGGYMKSLKDYVETGVGKPDHDNEY